MQSIQGLSTPIPNNPVVFYVRGETNLIDLVNEDGHGRFSGETLDEIRMRCPGVILTTMAEAHKDIEKVNEKIFSVPPEEITEEQYDEALCVLPPENYTNVGSASGFRSMEYMTAMWTAHYAGFHKDKGGTYFTAMRRAVKNSVNDFIEECRKMLT